MEDMEILRQMIKETARVEIESHYDKKKVVLFEPQSPGLFIEICRLPPDALVVRVDAFLSPDGIFKGSQGECKRADYAIISSEKKRILYIEMKKTKDKWHDIVKQLMGAECFVKYCQEIGRLFWKTPQFLQGYEHRFVSIGHIHISKSGTKITKIAPINDSPERALKIDWSNRLQFKQLG